MDENKLISYDNDKDDGYWWHIDTIIDRRVDIKRVKVHFCCFKQQQQISSFILNHSNLWEMNRCQNNIFWGSSTSLAGNSLVLRGWSEKKNKWNLQVVTKTMAMARDTGLFNGSAKKMRHSVTTFSAHHFKLSAIFTSVDDLPSLSPFGLISNRPFGTLETCQKILLHTILQEKLRKTNYNSFTLFKTVKRDLFLVYEFC